MEMIQLVKSCQQGSLDDFKELYLLKKDSALRTAYLISGNKSIAEDIVQESFVQCF